MSTERLRLLAGLLLQVFLAPALQPGHAQILIPCQSPRDVNAFDGPEPVPKESDGHRKSSLKFVSDWHANNVKTLHHKTITRSL